MKLKEVFVKQNKEDAYEQYSRIVYEIKYYDNITRAKMADEIINQYNYEEFLYNICTGKELEFLSKLESKKIKDEDLENYTWEIQNLIDKAIIDDREFQVYDEQKKNVQDALKVYQENKLRKEKEIELIIFIIGFVKVYAEVLTKVLTSMICDFTKIKPEDFDKILGNPLIHFYCDFDDMDFHGTLEEVIYFRDHWDSLDIIRDLRKEKGIAGKMQIDFQDFFDIFYYGMPIRKPSVKKFYKAISNNFVTQYFYTMILEKACMYNSIEFLQSLIRDEKLLKLATDAFGDIPSPVLNGYTPNDYEKEKIKEVELDIKLLKIPQNNANLPRKAADLFYKVYFSLLEYVNNKYQIDTSLKKIYKQDNLDAEKLVPINKYIWSNRHVIDDYLKDNPYHFSKDELDIIDGFKSGIYKEFLVIGFEREYTMLLDLEEHKIYMIKGIRTNLDNLIDPDDIPVMIKTTLLMFNNKIIFNGIFSLYQISFGNDLKEQVIEDMHKTMKYYHL